MNRLNTEEQTNIINCLVNGCSIRATSRITNHSKNTIISFLIELGKACQKYQDKVLTNLPCTNVECDEIWTFCHCKQKNNKANVATWGDTWLWVALDVNTRLVINWTLGKRDLDAAISFMSNLESRLKNKVQLTTDGMLKYKEAVEKAFGGNVDYSMLIKEYKMIWGEDGLTQKRYGYNACVKQNKKIMTGKPNVNLISTSHVERLNLDLRMSMHPFARLSNGFAKKLINLKALISIYFMYYNFVRIHGKLKITPAMAINITSKLWEIKDLVKLTHYLYL